MPAINKPGMSTCDRCLWHITALTTFLSLAHFFSHELLVGAQNETDQDPSEAWWGQPKDEFELDNEPCVFTKPESGFLYGCHRECAGTPNATDAQLRCALESNCKGITMSRGSWQLRTGIEIGNSLTGEMSIRKVCRSGAPDYQQATQLPDGEKICGRAGVCLCTTPELHYWRFLMEKKLMGNTHEMMESDNNDNNDDNSGKDVDRNNGDDNSNNKKNNRKKKNKINDNNNNNNINNINNNHDDSNAMINEAEAIDAPPACCGNDVCEANECSANCMHDCGPNHSCSGIALDVSADKLQTPEAMKCNDNGICFCRDALDLNCCGDGTCAGPECMPNCPQDCAMDTARLCPAERNALARADLKKDIAPEPPLQVGLWETAPSEIAVVDDIDDEDPKMRLKRVAEHEAKRAEWEAKADQVGYDINGQPSIFISIASFRDDLCRGTVESALAHAAFPERVVFGIVQQNLPSDLDCIPSREECIAHGFRVDMPADVVRSKIIGEGRGRRRLCALLNNIRVHPVDARQAAGPTWARYRVDRLYQGETFVLQIDAHMIFTSSWDTDMIQQWSLTHNEYAVLTSYPTDTIRTVDRDGNRYTQSFPVICGADFVDEGVVRSHGAVEQSIDRRITNGPMLHPYFAAGMSFARGHRVLRVPNDCCTPMMFIGEEFGMTMRMWTRGYDLYAFSHSAIFHVYPWQRQEQTPLFWENSKNRPRPREQDRATRRLRAVLGMKVEGDYDHTGLANGTYALGRRRSVEQFARFFGLDVKTGEVQNDCDYVLYGGMHHALTQHMRPDGRGIDFSSSGAGAPEAGAPEEAEGCIKGEECPVELLDRESAATGEERAPIEF